MQAWDAPEVPRLPVPNSAPVLIHDTSTRQLENSAPNPSASFYACGITPYDATHIGHANTYVAFDLLYRAWLDAGKSVHFAQNITDVDDPLLERATATGVDWRELAASQIELFREDMTALRVMPPQNWITVTEAMPQIIDAVTGLVKKGGSYFDPNDLPSFGNASVILRQGADARQSAESQNLSDSHDVYYDVAIDPLFGAVSNLPPDEMLERFVGHGGDPQRPGKHNALDPILWRAHRPGEPEWDGSLIGIGRPGWHIGCTVIANQALGIEFDVTGGGKDLLFPHHEMSASIARVLYDNVGPDEVRPGAKHFMHCGLISYQGEKMSKSLGNLVLVSKLREQGVDPMAIRLTLLSHHYRSDWEWTDAELAAATNRLGSWRKALKAANQGAVTSAANKTVTKLRQAISNDLNAPEALEHIDNYFKETNRTIADDKIVTAAVDAILGIKL